MSPRRTPSRRRFVNTIHKVYGRKEDPSLLRAKTHIKGVFWTKQALRAASLPEAVDLQRHAHVPLRVRPAVCNTLISWRLTIPETSLPIYPMSPNF